MPHRSSSSSSTKSPDGLFECSLTAEDAQYSHHAHDDPEDLHATPIGAHPPPPTSRPQQPPALSTSACPPALGHLLAVPARFTWLVIRLVLTLKLPCNMS